MWVEVAAAAGVAEAAGCRCGGQAALSVRRWLFPAKVAAAASLSAPAAADSSVYRTAVEVETFFRVFFAQFF